MVRPFVSRKAHRKVLVAESLAVLPSLTNGEVNLHHLGPRFAVSASEYILGGFMASTDSHTSHSNKPQTQFVMPSVH